MAHSSPPASNAVCSELGRVVVDTNVDPTLVADNVVNAIGDCLAQRLVLKVMNANVFRSAFGMPLAATILKIPDQFLLFRIHRDRWTTAFLKSLEIPVEIFKLGVAVGMRITFASFAIGLQAVATLLQQSCHASIRDSVVPNLDELL